MRGTSSLLEQYRELVPEALLTEIYALAAPLHGLHVLHLNTTAKGGGVAMLLDSLLPLAEQLGIRNSWEIIQLDDPSCRFMAKLTDMLQGDLPGEITPQEHNAFIADLTQATLPLQTKHADLYYVHDIQLVPLSSLFPTLQPALWFCHIDMAHPNLQAENYVRQFLDSYALCAFNTPFSVLKNLRPGQAQVMTLGINPFAETNKPLTRAEGLEILSRCGIDTQRPLIAQVSRFGRWKNPWQVLEVYQIIKQELPALQLALVGAMEATDDIKALEILGEIQLVADGEPDVHLLSDPALVDHTVVNAFQRYSDVILQRSSREGFGLTITEAMWKGQPVVSTTATGARDQIDHGRTGYLVDDTKECAAYTLALLRDRDLHSRLGAAAHQHVRDHFLVPMMVRDYLQELTLMVNQSATPYEPAPESPPFQEANPPEI